MVEPPRSQRLVVLGLAAAAVAGTVAVRRRRQGRPAGAPDDPSEEPAVPAPQATRSQGDVTAVTLPAIPGAPDRSWRTAPADGVAILEPRMDDHRHGSDVARAASFGNGQGAPPVITASTAGARLGEPTMPPSRHRLSGAALAAIAAVFGLAAIGTGGWAFVKSVRDEATQPAAFVETQTVAERVAFLASKPTTERIPVRNAVGRIMLVVGAGGFGALVLDGLGHAPEGRAYQAWVIRPGSTAPVSAAVFSAREAVVPLTTLVPRGATVAITLERAGGVTAPTRTPKLLATR